MTIPERTRKLLWRRFGSRCVMCRRKLIVAGTLVRDECRILSARAGGPRYDLEFDHRTLNDYSNLLLICGVHHNLVDSQASKHAASRFANIKARHEILAPVGHLLLDERRQVLVELRRDRGLDQLPCAGPKKLREGGLDGFGRRQRNHNVVAYSRCSSRAETTITTTRFQQ